MSAEAPEQVSGEVTELLAAGQFRVRLSDGTLVTAAASVGVPLEAVATGNRVFLIPGEAACGGLIVQVQATTSPPSRSSRSSSPSTREARRLSPDKLKIDRSARPDWPTGAERIPLVGEEVYCTEGLCSVTRVLGRTGNGSRLLELRLEGGERRSFFAAASNVLVPPGAG